MKKLTVFMIMLLAGAFVLAAGCTSINNPLSPAAPAETAPAQTEVQTAAPTVSAPVYAVTEPVNIRSEDLITLKQSVSAVENAPELVVNVKLDASTIGGATGSGYKVYSVIFAYNYADVPADFNPQTKDDVVNAGIPFTTKLTTVYPNNVMTASADLPRDSTQGGLTVSKDYNYGVISTLDKMI